jgi:5-methylcytosine-specific restriction endonuclease McrA
VARRQTLWARRVLAALRTQLGAHCAHCGAADELQFDCIVPQGHAHHAAGLTGRACFYRAHASWGNIQLLCPTCHAAKSRRELEESLTSESQVPF